MKISTHFNLQMLDVHANFHNDGRYSLGDIGFETNLFFFIVNLVLKNCKKRKIIQSNQLLAAGVDKTQGNRRKRRSLF